MFNCMLVMRQILSLLVINAQQSTQTTLNQAANIFAGAGAHNALNETVIFQSADITALTAQVNALEVELATPLSTYAVPSPNQSLTHLFTAGNHLVQSGACTFVGFTVNTGQASAKMSLYDGISAAGTLLGVFDCDVTDESSRTMLWRLTVGCFCVIIGTPDLTIVLQ